LAYRRALAGALVLLGMACAGGPATAATSVADFYKGKTIDIIVGFGPGGGYDLYARMLAQVLGDHIPGRPKVVVEDMDGAGSVRAANYVYNEAPKDGTAIAAVNQNAPSYQLLGGAGAEFDSKRLQWLGSMSHTNGLVYTWYASGIKTLDDAKKKTVPLGGVGPSSDSYIYPTLINNLLGTRFEVINGYSGTGQINLAIQRREVAGRGGNGWTSVKSESAEWVRDKKLNFLVQIGFKPEPELSKVPLLIDLVHSQGDRQVVRLMTLPTALGYAHWVAPGVPADRVAALRLAYQESLQDPKLLATARKANGPIEFQSAASIEALVQQAADTPKPVLLRMAHILGWRS
jgi:tripartite-type tricarboxylate transporter receptor subunit TctC